MKIQLQDVYHGAALTQIVEHPSFKALNRVDEKYGHYLINHDKRIFVKRCSRDGSPWQFNFTVYELDWIKEDLAIGATVFLCLVCGQITVCALTAEQIRVLIDLDSENQQFIRVEVPEGASMRVYGSCGYLKKKVAHKSFPDIIFRP